MSKAFSQSREEFHALQAAESQIAIEVGGDGELWNGALAAEFFEEPAQHLQHALAYARQVQLCRDGRQGFP